MTVRLVASQLKREIEAIARGVTRQHVTRYEWRTVVEVLSGSQAGRGGTVTVVDGAGATSYGIRWLERRPALGDVVMVAIPPTGGTRRVVAIDRELSEGSNSGNPHDLPVYMVEDFGSVGDGTADDTAALQAALDAAAAGGGGTVMCAKGGTHSLIGMLTIEASWVRLDLNGATLLRTGSSADPVVWVRTPDLQLSKIHHTYVGNGTIDGGTVAAYAVRIRSANYVDVGALRVQNVRDDTTSDAISMDCWDDRPVGADARDNQHCRLHDIDINVQDTDTNGLRMHGNADAVVIAGDGANSSLNRVDNVFVRLGDGDAFYLGNADGNVLSHLRVYPGTGTGRGLVFAAGVASGKGHARENLVYGVQASGAEVWSLTGTQNPRHNVIFGNSLGNGGATPNIAGSADDLLYVNSDGTSNFISGGSGLSDGDYGDVVVSGSGTAMAVESASGQFAFTGTATSSTATGNITALSITNTRYRWNGASGGTLCGIAGGVNGRLIIVANISTSQTLTLAHQSATDGTAANRLICPGGVDLVLGTSEAVWLYYDGTTSRWRVMFRRIGATEVDGLATVATTGLASSLSGTLAAAQLPALSGDVTSTVGTATTSIAARAVTAGKLFAATATSRFLLRKTASGGDWEEGTASDAKTILAIAQADVSGLTTASTPTFAGVTATGGRVRFNSALSPAQITADQNDYSPTSFDGTINVLKITLDTAHNITGLLAGTEGDLLVLLNLTTSSGTATLKNESASSSANNRFHGRNSADLALNAGGAVMLFYTGNRWRILTT